MDCRKNIKKKNKHGKVFYEVKWKGYDETTDEPATNIRKDVPEMVKEFEKGFKEK